MGLQANRAWQAVCAALIGALLLYLFLVAFRITVDYFDAFDNLLNAKSIAYGGRFAYTPMRPILLPTLLAPYFVLERALGSDLLGWTAAHLTAVALFALLLGAFHRLLRLDLSPRWAAVGTLCLALNPLLIHNAPNVKEDVPAALFTTLAFLFYLEGSRARDVRRWVAAGLFIGVASLTRYNMAPLLFAAIGAHELLSGGTRFRRGERLPAKLVTLFLLPVAIVCAWPMLVYPLIDHAPWWKATPAFFREFLEISWMVRLYEWESLGENFRFVLKPLTPALAACGLLGLLASWRRATPSGGFQAVWLAVFFAFHTLLIRHKEARYLFPLLPPVYFFVTRGLEELVETVERWLGREAGREWRAAVIVILIMALTVPAALRECALFRDPVYTESFERRVSLVAREQAGDASIFWLGQSYPLHPRDYWFDRDDEFTSIYHFGPPAVEFFSGRTVDLAQAGSPLPSTVPSTPPSTPNEGVVAARLRRPASFHDGDLLIVNQEPAEYVTATLPAKLAPLVMQRLRILELTDAGSDATTMRFAARGAAAAPEATVELRRNEGGYSVEGRGLPNADYALYAEIGRSPQLLGEAASREGRLHTTIPSNALAPRGAPRRMLLYRYELIGRFTAPRRAGERRRRSNRRNRRAHRAR